MFLINSNNKLIAIVLLGLILVVSCKSLNEKNEKSAIKDAIALYKIREELKNENYGKTEEYKALSKLEDKVMLWYDEQSILQSKSEYHAINKFFTKLLPRDNSYSVKSIRFLSENRAIVETIRKKSKKSTFYRDGKQYYLVKYKGDWKVVYKMDWDTVE